MKRKANLAKERARVKAQKEEQERNARPQAVPNLNTLDIPADLALIFNKIDGMINRFFGFILLKYTRLISFITHFSCYNILYIIYCMFVYIIS